MYLIYIIFCQIKFPSVTVCNQNRVNCERLKDVMVMCKESNNKSEAPKTTDDATRSICSRYYGNGKLVVQYLYEQGQCWGEKVPESETRKNTGTQGENEITTDRNRIESSNSNSFLNK